MKQTAVDWLIDKLYDMNIRVTDDGEHGLELYEAFKKAKEMEKEQITEAYRTGVEEDVYNNPLKTGEQYYEQTFK